MERLVGGGSGSVRVLWMAGMTLIGMAALRPIRSTGLSDRSPSRQVLALDDAAL